MKSTNETTIFDNTANNVFDANDYLDDSYFSENDVIPFAQWFNPQKGRKIGIGIREDQAELANFQPDNRWEKVDVKFGDKIEKFWVSNTPRLICLNAVANATGIQGNICPVYMTDDTGKTTPFNKNTRTSAHKAWSFFVFCVVDDQNNVISDPIRLKIKQKSHMTLMNHYKLGGTEGKTTIKPFTSRLIEVFNSIGFKFPAGQRPSAMFYAFAVFEPIMERSDISSTSGTSSEACVVTGYSELNPQNLGSFFINKKHPSHEKITQFMQNILKYVDYKNSKEESTETTESTVYENPVQSEEEVLASLVNGDVPF